MTLLSLMGLQSCTHTDKEGKLQPNSSGFTETKESHAIGFHLEEVQNNQLLYFYRHYNTSTDTLRYILLNENQMVPEQFTEYHRINVPVRRIALLHTSYYSYFTACGAENAIAALSEAKYIYDQSLYNEVTNGKIPEVSFGENLDKEKILELDIDLVINVGFPEAPNRELDFLETLGIPVLVFAEWQEPHPLGRAEWIKVVGAITGSSVAANHYFDSVATEYNRLKSLTSDVSNRPGVICNLPYKGIWYLPGGNSYMGNLINDSGAKYIWKDNKETGGIQLSFEVVYAEGLTAAYWLNPGLSSRIGDLTGTDERLRDFKALKDGNVYNSTNRVLRGEANDYWESGLINPHIMLADMLAIFHPELMQDYKLFYYKQLR